jgi:hypothetical protein
MKVTAYVFSDYWEDIGTVHHFYEVNIGLTAINPDFNLYLENAPIFTSRRDLPPSKISYSAISTSKARIGENCRIGVDALRRPGGDFPTQSIRDRVIVIPRVLVLSLCRQALGMEQLRLVRTGRRSRPAQLRRTSAVGCSIREVLEKRLVAPIAPGRVHRHFTASGAHE